MSAIPTKEPYDKYILLRLRTRDHVEWRKCATESGFRCLTNFIRHAVTLQCNRLKRERPWMDKS